MTSWPLSYQYKERARNNINIELKLSKMRVWRDKINHSGQTDGTLSALIKQSWHIYTNNRVVHINDKSHTCIYKYIFFLSLGKTSKFTWEKKKRERIYKCTLTLYISFSRTKPLPSPPGYHPKKQLGIVVIVLSSLFSDGLQSGRIGGLMWGYDGGWSHLNPRIQFSILFSHCGCL